MSRPQCLYTIDGPMAETRRGLRPWWTRRCRRTAKDGSLYCWQHQPPAAKGET